MTNITLANLIGLILRDLRSTFEQTVKPEELFDLHTSETHLDIPEEILNLQVKDIELDLPAHLHLQVDPFSPTTSPRLMVTLPSTLEMPSESRLGRIRMTIQSEQSNNYYHLDRNSEQ